MPKRKGRDYLYNQYRKHKILLQCHKLNEEGKFHMTHQPFGNTVGDKHMIV